MTNAIYSTSKSVLIFVEYFKKAIEYRIQLASRPHSVNFLNADWSVEGIPAVKARPRECRLDRESRPSARLSGGRGVQSAPLLRKREGENLASLGRRCLFSLH